MILRQPVRNDGGNKNACSRSQSMKFWGIPEPAFVRQPPRDTRAGQTVDGGLFLRVSQRFGSWVDHEDLDHSVGIEEDLAVVVDHFAA